MTSANTSPGQRESLPYVLPFLAFFVLLMAAPYVSGVLGVWEFPLRALLLSVVLFVFSRQVIDFRVNSGVLSVLVGIGVFFLWIGPDVLIPGYRQHWLFQNDIIGKAATSIEDAHLNDWLALSSRSFRAIVLVPIIEELFWRAWLMRWIIKPDFASLPLGTFSWTSMIVTAALFASEHGPFWDVGLVTGFIYNYWMVRTKSLGDCILMHAVTNACLCIYVIAFNRWEYWL